MSINNGIAEMSRARITVNVELVQLSLDPFVLLLTVKQLALDGSNQIRACEIEVNGKIGGIHFDGLAVTFIIYIFVPAAKSGGVTLFGQKVEIVRSRRGEIDESTELGSTTGGRVRVQARENAYFGFSLSYQR